MSGTAALILLAVAAGIAVAMQGQFIGNIERAVGPVTSVLITYGVGAVVAALVWLTLRPKIGNVREIPWYSWSAGLLGLVIVGGIGFAAPRLGLSRTLIITVAAQLGAALVIDHFGLFTATPRPLGALRALGFVLTVAGVWLVVKD